MLLQKNVNREAFKTDDSRVAEKPFICKKMKVVQDAGNVTKCVHAFINIQ